MCHFYMFRNGTICRDRCDKTTKGELFVQNVANRKTSCSKNYSSSSVCSMAVEIQNIPPSIISIKARPYAIVIETCVEPTTGATEPAIKDPKNMHVVPISQKIIVLISAMNMSFILTYLNFVVILNSLEI